MLNSFIIIKQDVKRNCGTSTSTHKKIIFLGSKGEIEGWNFYSLLFFKAS